MATNILTANNPDPLTGLNPVFLGWQFSGPTLADAFFGINLCWFAGWKFQLTEVPDTGDPTTSPPTPPLWAVQFTQPDITAVVVTDPDWIVFDGKYVRALSVADVAANYTVTVQ
jgi:hypothetical protein